MQYNVLSTQIVLCYNWFTCYYLNLKFCLIMLLISVIKYIGSIAILFFIKEIHFIAFVFASIVLTRIFLKLINFQSSH
jgi:hypothetical protein